MRCLIQNPGRKGVSDVQFCCSIAPVKLKHLVLWDELRLVIQPYQKKKKGPEKPPPTKRCTLPLPSSLTNGNTINDPSPQGAFQKCHEEASQAGEQVTVLSISREVPIHHI